METSLLNDEEKAIMNDLDGLPEPDQMQILADSLADEADPTGRRVLGRLLSKLKGGG